MNEYIAESGGRYTFAEDFLNLQDIALSYSGMFGDGKFVISGCEFKEKEVTPGVVYIDGKVRKFNGAYINPGTDTIYIVPTHTVTNTPYANGINKPGIEEYGCEALLMAPEDSSSIVINRYDGFGRLKEDYYGSMMLLLDTEKREQTVKGKVDFTDVLSAGTFKVGIDNPLTITSDGPHKVAITKKDCCIKFDDDIMSFSIEGVELMRIERDSVSIMGAGVTNFSAVNTDTLSTNTIQPNKKGEDLHINVGRSSDSYAVTVIGNGKGKAMMTFDGADNVIDIAADGIIFGTLAGYDGSGVIYRPKRDESGQYAGVSIIYKVGGEHNSMQAETSGISFNVVTRDIGFRTGTYIECSIYGSSIQFTGDTVNFDAKLYDRGVAFEQKYAQKEAGLAQFLRDGITKADLREQIGAAGNSTEILDSEIQKIWDYLNKDAAKDSEITKIWDFLYNEVANSQGGFENLVRGISPEQLRAQIGALGKDDVSTDTGWLTLGGAIEGSFYIKYMNGVIYVKVNCNAESIDQNGVTLAYPEDCAIPIPSAMESQYVPDSLGGIYRVSMLSGQRAIKISQTLQSNGSIQAHLSFTIPFVL